MKTYETMGLLWPETVRTIDKTKTDKTPLIFDGKGIEFASKALSKGIMLYAEGIRPSVVNAYHLTLSSKSNPTSTVTLNLTAVSLTLSICEVVGNPIVSSSWNCLPEPPPTPPASGTANDKWYKGGKVHLDPDLPRDNVALKIRVEPDNLNALLILRNVKISETKIGSLDNKAVFLVFDSRDEIKENPIVFSPIIGTEIAFRLRGKKPSVSLRDTGFQLGMTSLPTTGSVEEMYDGDRVTATVIVIPMISLDNNYGIVLVKKSYTDPARRKLTLKTSGRGNRPGTFTVSGKKDAIRIFDKAQGGTQINIDVPQKLSAEQLTKGVDWFIEGIQASDNVNDIEFQLAIEPGPPGTLPVADPVKANITSVELTLDICGSRPAAGVDPPVLPPPPDMNNKGCVPPV